MSNLVRIIGTSFLILSATILFVGCDLFGTETFYITYDANQADSGSVPHDGNEYEYGEEVTVRGNTGNLEREGFTFAGWNTQADGEGTLYQPDDTFIMGSENVMLYAKWKYVELSSEILNTTADDSSSFAESMELVGSVIGMNASWSGNTTAWFYFWNPQNIMDKYTWEFALSNVTSLSDVTTEDVTEAVYHQYGSDELATELGNDYGTNAIRRGVGEVFYARLISDTDICYALTITTMNYPYITVEYRALGYNGDSIPDNGEIYDYEEIEHEFISDQEHRMSEERINSSQDERNEIPDGTILLFRTKEGRFGKMQIIDNAERYALEFRFTVYSNDGNLFVESESVFVRNTWPFCLDTNTEGSPGDFWWEHTEFHGGGQPGDPIYLTPRNGARFYILNSPESD